PTGLLHNRRYYWNGRKRSDSGRAQTGGGSAIWGRSGGRRCLSVPRYGPHSGEGRLSRSSRDPAWPSRTCKDTATRRGSGVRLDPVRDLTRFSASLGGEVGKPLILGEITLGSLPHRSPASSGSGKASIAPSTSKPKVLLRPAR